jgi:hypothetical protein
MRNQGAVILAWLLVVGCGGGPTTAAVEPAATASTTCDDLLEQYRAVLAAGPGTCAADADCAIYGGVDPDNVCGGMTDADTARRLTGIADDSTEAGCPRPGYSCPPILVRCTDGLCR